MAETTEPTPLTKLVNDHRKVIKQIAASIKEDMYFVRTGNHHPATPAGEAQSKVEDRGEVMANLTLAYRCLEDASMRLGKALQAHDGGISVYDKETTVGA